MKSRRDRYGNMFSYTPALADVAYDYATSQVCSCCNKEFMVTSPAWMYKFKRKGKVYYFCGWNCYRSAKYEAIINGAKHINRADAHWLQSAGFDVPMERLSKEVRQELESLAELQRSLASSEE